MKSSPLLALEIGNSRVHFAQMENGRVLSRKQAETRDPESMEKAISWIREFSREGSRALWASVVPEWSKEFRMRARAEGIPNHAELRTETIPWSFELSYPEPHLFGIDRALACEGILAKSPTKPVLVIQAGTATTFDGLCPFKEEPKWRHLGGAIAPGVRLSLQVLSKEAALLPEISPEAGVPEFWGRATDAAIASGVLGGHAMMARGFADELTSDGQPLLIALTGGAASAILPWIRKRFRAHPAEIEDLPDLVMFGIARIHERLR